MKLLVSEPGRRVVQLASREWQQMRSVLGLFQQVGRRPPPITRGVADDLPADSAAMLAADVVAGLEAERSATLALLDDPARCVKGKGGYGLQVDEVEADRLLRVLNGARVACWEALGSPNFESGERVERTNRNRMLVTMMELAGALVSGWLTCLEGTTGAGET